VPTRRRAPTPTEPATSPATSRRRLPSVEGHSRTLAHSGVLSWALTRGSALPTERDRPWHASPVPRIAAISLILVSLLAGGVTLALAGSGRASAPITRAEAGRFAQAVNLKATDLPGATALRAIFGPEAVQYEALKCGRRGKGVATVGGGESWLSSSYGNVGSIVAVVPSQQLARTALALIGSSRGRICLSRALGRAYSFERHPHHRSSSGEPPHEIVTSHAVQVTFVPVAKLLGGGAIALHVLAKLPPIGEKYPRPKARYVNVNAAIFRDGPTVIAFLALGGPLPLATEIHLLALLHSRAEAHTL
jgi:hypothetical protein